MAKFRILHLRSGIQYKPEYRKSIKGAIKVANSKGWFRLHRDRNWSTKPSSATIEIKIESERHDYWETVATVTEKGVEPVAPSDRRSIIRARSKIAELTSQCEEADELSKTLAQMNGETK